MTIHDTNYVKISSVYPLYLIISKSNGYFGEINKNKCLTLEPYNESKEAIRNYEKRCYKIRDLIRSINKNLGDYNEKYMIIKFNSDDDLALNKAIKINNAT